ncbi:MAG: recombinase family protein [Oscillospiraceae bacterium]|nr:recombinase family protein [Oscillospiraceae bacterium]
MEQRIAIYLRLSLEDVDLRTHRSKDESNSVGNQRLLIKNYIEKHGDLLTLPIVEFCDDGYTGTNFERPQFQAMLDLAKAGKISCVIVKDLSRFGRSYLEVGDYLEHIFPFLGVRFIAVNDSFDSNDYIGVTSGIDIAFRNLIHQKYSEDLSLKVKSAMHMKMAKGKYVNHPPFGYVKSPADKHRIMPDPETAPIVRKIFDAVLAGHSTTEVAVMLNEQQIPTPMAYKQWKERRELAGRLPIWNHRTILRIITDLKYTGTMVNNKCVSRYIRDKTQRRTPPSEWIVTEGMHEGIVTKEEFQKAGEQIRNVQKSERKTSDTSDHVFYCGHCGRKLRKGCNGSDYYVCDTSRYQPNVKCGGYRWDKADLETVLLEAYKRQVSLLETRVKEVQSHNNKKASKDFISRLGFIEKTLEILTAEKLQRYEEYRSEQISKEAFLDLKTTMSEKITQMKAEKADIEQQLLINQQTTDQAENMVAALASVASVVSVSDDELRAQMYADIDRVLIFSDADIEIRWKFADVFQSSPENLSEQDLVCAL